MPLSTSTSESDSDVTTIEIEHPKEYVYFNLKTKKAIRLLVLHPGWPRTADIVCELKEHDLEQDDTKYEALSWAWGAELWTGHVLLRDQNRDHKLKVPINLMSALRALRSRKYYRTLWVDAICINQLQTEEKSTQVPLMSEVYGRAQKVCIWLGAADEESKLALDFIRNSVLDFHTFDDLCEDPTAGPKWIAMFHLMQRPWFSRRWVVQEIALCHDAIVHCGQDTISWKDFAGAIQLVVEAETAKHTISKALMRIPEFRRIHRHFESVSSVGASLLVDASRKMFRTTTENKLQPLLSIEYLVSSLQAFEVTEPRDSIYALLAVAKDTMPVFTNTEWKDPNRSSGITNKGANFFIKALTPNFPTRSEFKVDYSQSYVDVCQQFISFCISKSDTTRALDIICRPWAPDPKPKPAGSKGNPQPEKMPTWVPRLSDAAHSIFSFPGNLSRKDRKNADSLVGLPGLSSNYSAAGSRPLVTEILRFRKRNSHYSMFVSGFILGEVGSTTDISQNGYIPYDWLTFGNWKNLEEEPPSEFWRTLIADRDKDGGPTPIYGARAFQLSVVKSSGTGYMNTSELVTESQSFVISEFFRRVQAVIWNRCLMKTKDGGLGIVRQAVKTNDLICVLYGCSVPVILRKHIKSDKMLNAEKTEDRVDMEKRLLRAAHFVRKRRREILSRRKSTGSSKTSNGTTDPTEPLTPTSEASGVQLLDGDSILAKLAEEFLDSNRPENYYDFLGECYVHGMMDGEAIGYRDVKDLKNTVFEIR